MGGLSVIVKKLASHIAGFHIAGILKQPWLRFRNLGLAKILKNEI
jgi:hypothetical protein